MDERKHFIHALGWSPAVREWGRALWRITTSSFDAVQTQLIYKRNYFGGIKRVLTALWDMLSASESRLLPHSQYHTGYLLIVMVRLWLLEYIECAQWMPFLIKFFPLQWKCMHHFQLSTKRKSPSQLNTVKIFPAQPSSRLMKTQRACSLFWQMQWLLSAIIRLFCISLFHSHSELHATQSCAIEHSLQVRMLSSIIAHNRMPSDIELLHIFCNALQCFLEIE